MPIRGFPGYEVSTRGRVRSWKPVTRSNTPRSEPRLLKPWVNQKRTYPNVVLVDSAGRKRTKKIHRLVAAHFIPNPENKPHVAHNNGNTFDNWVSNLRWATAKENNADKHFHGTRGIKISLEDADEIRRLYAGGGLTQVDLAAMYGIGRSTVGEIVRNECWTAFSAALDLTHHGRKA